MNEREGTSRGAWSLIQQVLPSLGACSAGREHRTPQDRPQSLGPARPQTNRLTLGRFRNFSGLHFSSLEEIANWLPVLIFHSLMFKGSMPSGKHSFKRSLEK